MEKKNELNAAMGNKRAEGIAMKDDLQKMKKSIGYASEADIDNRIATIEFKLQTESMPLKDEKKFMLELSELKKNRPKVAKAKHREEKKAIQEKLAKLRDERKAKLGDVPTWVDERQKLSEQIGELVKQKNTIRDEFKAKEREFYQYLAEVRKARQEKQQEE